jgi:hypothetical protein
MLNDRSEYERAGERAGIARSHGDEATAKHWSQWARRAIALEKGEDATTARELFDAGYKRAREVDNRWRDLR